MINAPIEKVLAPLDNLEFFWVMATMLERNPVPDSDRGLPDCWKRIGLIPGRFDLAGLSPAVQRGLTRAIAAGSRIVEANIISGKWAPPLVLKTI